MYAYWCRWYERLDVALQNRRGWDVTARTLLAIFGGYGLTVLITISLSFALPLPKAQAVLAATLMSFCFYAILVIWAFCAATALRAWCWALYLAIPPALHLLLRGLLV